MVFNEHLPSFRKNTREKAPFLRRPLRSWERLDKHVDTCVYVCMHAPLHTHTHRTSIKNTKHSLDFTKEGTKQQLREANQHPVKACVSSSKWLSGRRERFQSLCPLSAV